MNTSPAEIPDNILKIKHSTKRTVGLCSFLCLCSIFISGILGLLINALGMNKQLIPYIVSLGVVTICAILLPSLFMIRTGGSIKKCLRLKSTKTGAFDSLLIVVFGLCGCLTASFLADLVTSFLPEKTASSHVIFDGNYFAVFLMFISYAVLPAICEEICYRGYIYKAAQRYGQLYAVIFSSFLFALMHSDIPQIIFAFMCGLIIGSVRKTTGSITLGIIIHFLNNLMSVTSTLIKLYGGNQALVSYIVTNIAFVLLIICAYILHKRNVRLFSFRNSPYPLTKKDKIIATISCPIFLGFIAAAVIGKFL